LGAKPARGPRPVGAQSFGQDAPRSEYAGPKPAGKVFVPRDFKKRAAKPSR
jgi:hypothetical protein